MLAAAESRERRGTSSWSWPEEGDEEAPRSVFRWSRSFSDHAAAPGDDEGFATWVLTAAKTRSCAGAETSTTVASRIFAQWAARPQQACE